MFVVVLVLAMTTSEIACDNHIHPPPRETLSELPEVNMNVTEMIAYRGYPFEIHGVHTDDGFILTLIRIPHGGRESAASGSKGSVFLQHGLLDCSTTWVINNPKQSLGFIMADAGVRCSNLLYSHVPNYRRHFTDFSENTFDIHLLPTPYLILTEKANIFVLEESRRPMDSRLSVRTSVRIF